MSTKSTIRSRKDERRREIVEFAVREFAVRGLHGTPVEAIAKKVGVSQPYLFQLFGTKKDLFIAAVRRCFERTVGTFRTAAAEAGADASTEDILMSMGLAYHHLVQDRSLLMMQMQSYVACEDEEVREVVREEFTRLVRFVQSASGANDQAVRDWLAFGMLMNVGAAMDLNGVDEDWARVCLGADEWHQVEDAAGAQEEARVAAGSHGRSYPFYFVRESK